MSTVLGISSRRCRPYNTLLLAFPKHAERHGNRQLFSYSTRHVSMTPIQCVHSTRNDKSMSRAVLVTYSIHDVTFTYNPGRFPLFSVTSCNFHINAKLPQLLCRLAAWTLTYLVADFVPQKYSASLLGSTLVHQI